MPSRNLVRASPRSSDIYSYGRYLSGPRRFDQNRELEAHMAFLLPQLNFWPAFARRRVANTLQGTRSDQEGTQFPTSPQHSDHWKFIIPLIVAIKILRVRRCETSGIVQEGKDQDSE